MASPDQTPPEENKPQDGNEMVEPPTPPLFEFPPTEAYDAPGAANTMETGSSLSEQHEQSAEFVQPAPITRVLPEEEAAAIPSTLSTSPTPPLPSKLQEPMNEEAVRKGLVYPPPPSFYQNMPDVSAPPILPPGRVPRQPSLSPINVQSPADQFGAGSSQPRVFQPPQPGQPGQQSQQGQQVPPGYPPYPPYAPYPPGYVPPYAGKPPIKKSRRWLWITLSIVGVVLLASCGLCGWAAYNLFSPAVQSVTNSLNVVEDYYSALQAKNYAAAFDDISTQSQLSGLTEAKFAQEASARDTQYGAILSYNPGNPAYSTDTNNGFTFTHFTYSVSVKRPNLSYTSTLSLDNINNQWKITNFDSV